MNSFKEILTKAVLRVDSMSILIVFFVLPFDDLVFPQDRPPIQK
jgi:hypothetical protein